MSNKEKVFAFIKDKYTESEVYGMIDEGIYDYLDDDWEDEWEDEWEAYTETGRGEAESDVINQIIFDSQNNLNIDLNGNDFSDVMYMVAEHLDVTLH